MYGYEKRWNAMFIIRYTGEKMLQIPCQTTTMSQGPGILH